MFRVVIPARHASARLPGKPLLDIAGKPMIQHVWERAMTTCAHEVVIATDDERIARAAAGFGADVQMTSASHPSGTDRLAEVAVRRSWRDGEVVVNVQGDEPLMPAALVRQAAALLEADPGADIATLCTPVVSIDEMLNPNVCKLVRRADGRALYFSRAPIPWHRDSAPSGIASQREFAGALRHIGLYAYRVGALKRLSVSPPSALEQAERLEQLRALHLGMAIVVAEACERPGPGVDTAADLDRVRALLAAGH